MVEWGIMVKFPFIPWPLVTFPCSSCLRVLSAKMKLCNSIIDIHKDPTSWVVWCPLKQQNTCHLPPCTACQHSASNVTRTCQESSACLSSCWWSMHTFAHWYTRTLIHLGTGALAHWHTCTLKVSLWRIRALAQVPHPSSSPPPSPSPAPSALYPSPLSRRLSYSLVWHGKKLKLIGDVQE